MDERTSLNSFLSPGVLRQGVAMYRREQKVKLSSRVRYETGVIKGEEREMGRGCWLKRECVEGRRNMTPTGGEAVSSCCQKGRIVSGRLLGKMASYSIVALLL